MIIILCYDLFLTIFSSLKDIGTLNNKIKLIKTNTPTKDPRKSTYKLGKSKNARTNIMNNPINKEGTAILFTLEKK